MLHKQIKEALDTMKQQGNYEFLQIEINEFESLLTELEKLENALLYYSKGNDWDFGALAREVLDETKESSEKQA